MEGEGGKIPEINLLPVSEFMLYMRINDNRLLLFGIARLSRVMCEAHVGLRGQRSKQTKERLECIALKLFQCNLYSGAIN